MKIYNYDGSGIYISSSNAALDPVASRRLERDVFLIPANATEIEPMSHEAGFIPVFSGSKWMLKEDHRGVLAYNSNDESVIISSAGSLAQLGLTLDKPVEPLHNHTSAKRLVIVRILKESGAWYGDNDNGIRALIHSNNDYLDDWNAAGSSLDITDPLLLELLPEAGWTEEMLQDLFNAANAPAGL